MERHCDRSHPTGLRGVIAVESHPPWLASRILLAVLATCSLGLTQTGDFDIHRFDRQRLTGEYYSEGIAAGDLNRDGSVDIAHGPYWFAGPKFEEKHEVYPPKPQDREGYADHFFAWEYDFNGDGWNERAIDGNVVRSPRHRICRREMLGCQKPKSRPIETFSDY
jgi:hypothetical protein